VERAESSVASHHSVWSEEVRKRKEKKRKEKKRKEKKRKEKKRKRINLVGCGGETSVSGGHF
jgi:hypothetical protein